MSHGAALAEREVKSGSKVEGRDLLGPDAHVKSMRAGPCRRLRQAHLEVVKTRKEHEARATPRGRRFGPAADDGQGLKSRFCL